MKAITCALLVGVIVCLSSQASATIRLFDFVSVTHAPMVMEDRIEIYNAGNGTKQLPELHKVDTDQIFYTLLFNTLRDARMLANDNCYVRVWYDDAFVSTVDGRSYCKIVQFYLYKKR